MQPIRLLILYVFKGQILGAVEPMEKSGHHYLRTVAIHHHDNGVNRSCITLPAWLQVQKDSHLVEPNHKESVDNTNANTIAKFSIISMLQYAIICFLIRTTKYNPCRCTIDNMSGVQAHSMPGNWYKRPRLNF